MSKFRYSATSSSVPAAACWPTHAVDPIRPISSAPHHAKPFAGESCPSGAEHERRCHRVGRPGPLRAHRAGSTSLTVAGTSAPTRPMRSCTVARHPWQRGDEPRACAPPPPIAMQRREPTAAVSSNIVARPPAARRGTPGGGPRAVDDRCSVIGRRHPRPVRRVPDLVEQRLQVAVGQRSDRRAEPDPLAFVAHPERFHSLGHATSRHSALAASGTPDAHPYSVLRCRRWTRHPNESSVCEARLAQCERCTVGCGDACRACRPNPQADRRDPVDHGGTAGRGESRRRSVDDPGGSLATPANARAHRSADGALQPSSDRRGSRCSNARCVSLAAVDGRRQLGRSAVGAGAGEDPHLSHPGPLRRQRRQARVQRRLGGTRIYSMRRPDIARAMTSCWIS